MLKIMTCSRNKVDCSFAIAMLFNHGVLFLGEIRWECRHQWLPALQCEFFLFLSNSSYCVKCKMSRFIDSNEIKMKLLKTKKLYKPKFEDKMNSCHVKIHIRKFAKWISWQEDELSNLSATSPSATTWICSFWNWMKLIFSEIKKNATKCFFIAR